MATIFSSVFTLCLRRLLSLATIVCLLSCGTNCLAQHHSGHFHSVGFGGVSNNFGGGGAYNHYGVYNGSGAYNGPYHYNYGGFNANAPLGGFNASAPLGGFNANAPLGGVSFGNGFGTATYSSRNFGVTTYGVSPGGFGGCNSGFGGYNYGFGYGSPVIWSMPFYNYSPSVFGYGTGVFSPNFPSGNYISNGYIGFVPSGADNVGAYSGWPNATCMNPYFPGAGIAPTLLMVNMNLIMPPELSSTSSYSLIDPRMIDMLAPAADPNAVDLNGAEVPPVPQPAEPSDQPVLPDEPPLPVQADAVPVLNEFHAVPREQKISSLAEKIHSLRYQASGDDAFRKSDYAAADMFYATAIKTAPDRRAPYLRMAMVRIAFGDFPVSTSYLKTGLAMESDASRPWFTAEELYGQKVAERARSHGAPLWNWLAERPMSADRLLLAGTFQKLRCYNKTADEMLVMASHSGPEATLVSEVMHLAATDIGQRAISHDLAQLVEHASALKEPSVEQESDLADKRAVEQADGIFLRSRDVAARTDGSIAPLPDAGVDGTPVPFTIPVPERN